MIRSELRTEVLRLLDDTAQVTFSSTIVNDWLDLANVDLHERLNIDRAMATITTVNSEPNYQLPTTASVSYLSEIYFDYPNGVGEERIKIITQDELNEKSAGWRADADGTPRYAYLADYNVIGLHPAPDSAHANRTVRIFYYAIPADFASDSATPIFINALHDALVYFCVARGFELRQNFKAAEYHKREYERIILRHTFNQQRFSDDLLAWRW